MPTFVPFRGLRYQLDGADRSDVVAPPYDVISATDRAELVQRSLFISVRVELPEEDADTGRDKYQVAHD
ncbi:MAG: DUF1015 family protein, partial [Acidimicrobiales bacterium]